jgi:hypothetical protein
MKSWRNLPPALLASLVVELVASIAFTYVQLTRSLDSPSIRWDLAERGFWLAADVLAIFGALALARRLTGLAATGFRLVAAGFTLSIVQMVGWEMFDAFQPHWNVETVGKVSQWAWFAIALLEVGGAALAAAPTRRGLAVAGVAVAILANPPPPLASHMYAWLVHGWKASVLLQQAMHLASLGVIAAVALALAPEPYPAPPADAVPGFRAIASGLWLRVIAACTFAGLMLSLVLGKSGAGAIDVLKLATISVAVVNVTAFVIIARGALATLVRDMPRFWMTLGATANLWCLGVTVAQLATTYRLLYGGHDDFGYGSTSLEDRAQALAAVAPLVGVAAIAAIATAIAGFAANRGLDQLRVEAQGKGLGFVTLMVAAVGIQGWLLPDQTSDGNVVFFLLAAAGCSLGATVLMARLCTRAADSLHAEMPLPTATLRS